MPSSVSRFFDRMALATAGGCAHFIHSCGHLGESFLRVAHGLVFAITNLLHAIELLTGDICLWCVDAIKAPGMSIKAVCLEAIHCGLIFLSFAARRPSDYVLLFVARLVLGFIEYYLAPTPETRTTNANDNETLEDNGSLVPLVNEKVDYESLPVCRNNGISICFPIAINPDC